MGMHYETRWKKRIMLVLTILILTSLVSARYGNSKTTLKQFVERYGNGLRGKVEKENHVDFNYFDYNIPCVTHYAMEQQF